MKRWSEPQMRVYDVKLNENLATSGTDSGAVLTRKEIYLFSHSVEWELLGTYWVNENNWIQNTVPIQTAWEKDYVAAGQESLIASCVVS